jgi:hypothetical protein
MSAARFAKVVRLRDKFCHVTAVFRDGCRTFLAFLGRSWRISKIFFISISAWRFKIKEYREILRAVHPSLFVQEESVRCHTPKRSSSIFYSAGRDKNNTQYAVYFLLTKGRQNDMFRHLLNEYSIVFLTVFNRAE